MATLSIVFGIVFAPIGAVLGHVALSQIKKTGEKGRERALIGLTLSYLMIFVGIIALVVFLVLHKNDSSSSTTTTTTTTSKTSTSKTTTKRTTPRSTVPASPPVPQTATVDDLRVGDCVRIQEHGNDPDNPNATAITITMAACAPGPDVYHVDQVSKVEGTCPGDTLYNTAKTTFVCVSQYRG